MSTPRSASAGRVATVEREPAPPDCPWNSPANSTANSPANSTANSTADLVELHEAADGLRIALVYATADNLLGRPVYAPGARCALRPAAAACLRRAARAARQSGHCLMVLDAYRPSAVQAMFWAALQDARYVADPAQGSNHTRGVAVDVSLLDAAGQPLDMGTGFDDMRELAHHDREDLPAAVQRNRQILLGIMWQAGFRSIPTEWWHYELPAAQEYALLPESPMVRALNVAA